MKNGNFATVISNRKLCLDEISIYICAKERTNLFLFDLVIGKEDGQSGAYGSFTSLSLFCVNLIQPCLIDYDQQNLSPRVLSSTLSVLSRR